METYKIEGFPTIKLKVEGRVIENGKIHCLNYYTKLKNESEKIILKSNGTVMRFANVYGQEH